MAFNMYQRLHRKSSGTAPSQVRDRQGKCDCGGRCERCTDGGWNQHAHTPELSTAAQFAPPIVHEVLRSPGQSLDPKTRSAMELRFGHNFRNVRIHDDARAAESAHVVGALAYTVGTDIVFGSNQFSPNSGSGQRVLAHELTHVIQQESMGPVLSPRLEISSTGSGEHEAERAAANFAAGVVSKPSITRLPQRLQRTSEEIQRRPQRCVVDPDRLSELTAKHFLDDVLPGTGSRVVKSKQCVTLPNGDRIECEVTFDDGETVRVTIIPSLQNCEGQRSVPGGRQWCVYHYDCEPKSDPHFEKKACRSDFSPVYPMPTVGPEAAEPGTEGAKGGEK
jgi:hypothetical protein